MPNHPNHAAKIRQGIEAKNIAKIEEAYQALSESSLQELLEQLEIAIDDGRYEDARTIYNELLQTYEDIRKTETRKKAKITVARTLDEASLNTVEELTTYLRNSSRTAVQRAQLVKDLGLLLQSKTEEGSLDDVPTSDEVSTSISETKEEEARMEENTETTIESISDLSLPPSLEITDMHIENEKIGGGESTTVTVSVDNVGSGTVRHGSITIDSLAGISVDPTEISFDGLDSEESITEMFSLTSDTEGVYSISVEVTGEPNVNASSVETLVVADDGGSSEGPLSHIDKNDNNRIDRSEVIDAINAYYSGDSIGGKAVDRRAVINAINAYYSDETI